MCTASHDYEKRSMPMVSAPILIESDVWVCAESFIGPGVSLGKGVVCLARSVVVKSVEELTVVGGHPARYIKKRLLREE